MCLNLGMQLNVQVQSLMQSRSTQYQCPDKLFLRKNFENSDRSMYAICVGWVNFVHSLRCLLKNLRSQQKFYATAGPTGRDKYHLWVYDAVSG